MSISTDAPLAESIHLLERAPRTLTALLAGLPHAYTHAREAPGEWSPHEVVCHMIVAEHNNWLPRARHILAGDARPFQPFDRAPGAANLQDASSDHVLAAFEQLRAENLAALRQFNLSNADLARTGQHPEFGTVTLAQLLATWAVHDLNHLGQIVRTLALCNADAVGPWRAYLDILRPNTGG